MDFIISLARFARTIDTRKVWVVAPNKDAAIEKAFDIHWQKFGGGTQVVEVSNRTPTDVETLFYLVNDWRTEA